MREVKSKVKEAYLMFVILLGIKQTKNSKLLAYLHNAYNQGRDEYPKTTVGAHTLLGTWENKSES
eukprot:4732309-Ditylum_brightwellii.AAC.1